MPQEMHFSRLFIYSYGYRSSLVEKIVTILLRLLLYCKQIHTLGLLLELQKQSKDFQNFHEQANIVLINWFL